MASARKGSSSGSSARKSAPATTSRTSANTSASTTATADRKPRKPPLDRASKLASQITRKLAALVKQAAKWRGECSAEQKLARDQVVEALGLLKEPVGTLGEGLAFLQRSNWKPTLAGPNRKVLLAGVDLVRIREKHYDAEAHGPNLFDVVKTTDRNVALTNRATKASVAVPKSWVEKVEATDGSTDDDDDERDVA